MRIMHYLKKALEVLLTVSSDHKYVFLKGQKDRIESLSSLSYRKSYTCIWTRDRSREPSAPTISVRGVINSGVRVFRDSPHNDDCWLHRNICECTRIDSNTWSDIFGSHSLTWKKWHLNEDQTTRVNLNMNKGQHFVAFITIHHRVIEQISRYLQKHAMPQLFPDTDLRGEVQAN